MKREIKKRVNKKVVILLLVLLSFTLVSLILVNAADASISAYGTDSLFGRWLQGMLTDFDAKIIIFIMVFVVVYLLLVNLQLTNPFFSFIIAFGATFVLTVYVTPESVLGILRSYNTLPLIIATILPMMFLFGFSYLAVTKESKPLQGGQAMLWGIFFFWTLLKTLAAGLLYFNWLETYGINGLFKYLVNPPPIGSEQFAWFWFALLTTLVVSQQMFFYNGKWVGLAEKSRESVDELKAKQTEHDLEVARAYMQGIAQGAEGKKK
jgi:hypothetical protein